ncbi:MAG TPA: restriction endonuclease subunit S, partial [Pseudobdellovibrionaceae bacterium]|nr:restriction endonuclease subunit S [Pseudobdellovibrionaceae bacterium]
MIFNDSKYNSSWNIKSLDQLGEFKRGKSKHRPRNDPALFIDGIYPLIQTGDIKAANLYIRKHSEMYNGFGLKQSKLWRENTLCITIAANIAETALLGYPMCFPDSVVGFTAFPDESSEIFMHYVFEYIKENIQNTIGGSIQDNINIEYLTGLNFRIPDKPYQDKIAAVLSSLDAKIELNQRINAELEAMAKTLYDYWFVQFDFPDEEGKPYKSSGGKIVWNEALKREIPEGWEVSE